MAEERGSNYGVNMTNNLLQQLINVITGGTSVRDKSFLYKQINVSSEPVALPEVPAGISRVVISVSGGDAVFSTLLSSVPQVSPLVGFRLAEGSVQEIFPPDVVEFRIIRLGNADVRLNIDYKKPV